MPRDEAAEIALAAGDHARLRGQLDAALGAVRQACRDGFAAAHPAVEAHAVAASAERWLARELTALVPPIDAEAKRLASERQRRSEQVEAMQTLCAGLAHEVRNPLNSAKLQLELAARRSRRRDDDPRVVEPIELAGHELDRLTTLLDEFLAFARPAGLDPHAHDVVAIARAVIAAHQPAAARRGVELSLVGVAEPGVAEPAVAEPIVAEPIFAEPIFAEIDAPKIRDVIDKLVCNAIEAVPAGGHVSLAVARVAGLVRVRIRDDGGGIPAEILPRIYDPFFSTKEGGTGMGMSIAHSLIALHRGTIDVVTSPAGTTFEIAVPARQPAD